MRSYNDAHSRRYAKIARGNTLFRNETVTRFLSPAALCVTFMAIAAALPAGLLFQKRETQSAAPYLELELGERLGVLSADLD